MSVWVQISWTIWVPFSRDVLLFVCDYQLVIRRWWSKSTTSHIALKIFTFRAFLLLMWLFCIHYIDFENGNRTTHHSSQFPGLLAGAVGNLRYSCNSWFCHLAEVAVYVQIPSCHSRAAFLVRQFYLLFRATFLTTSVHSSRQIVGDLSLDSWTQLLKIPLSFTEQPGIAKQQPSPPHIADILSQLLVFCRQSWADLAAWVCADCSGCIPLCLAFETTPDGGFCWGWCSWADLGCVLMHDMALDCCQIAWAATRFI